MNVFPSKIDRWLAVVAIAPMVLAVLSTLWVSLHGRGLFPLLVVVAAFVLVLSIFGRTNYTIDGRTLVIRSGPFRWRVPVDEIESVTPTHNPLSAPALSLDRLSIRYGNREILISPRERERFIEALRAVNPKIA